MSEILQPERPLNAPHPDADRLHSLSERKLPPDEHNEVLAHLADCPECRGVAAMARPPLEVFPMVEPTRGSVGWRLARVAAPVLVALVILAVCLRARVHGRNPVAAPAQVAQAYRRPQPVPVQSGEGPKSDRSRQESPAAKPRAASRNLTSPSLTSPNSAPEPKFRTAVPAHVQTTPAGASRGVAPVKPTTSVRSSATTAPAARPSSAASPHLQSPTSNSDAVLQVGPDAGQPETVSNDASGSGPSGKVIDVPPADRIEDEAAAQTGVPGRDVSSSAAGAAPPADGFRRNTLVSVQAALPSALPIVSFAANRRQRLAIDNGNQLFFSEDSGQHWKAVASPWRGRAIIVARISPATYREPSRLSSSLSSSPAYTPQSQLPSPAVAFAVPDRFAPGETAVADPDISTDSLSGKVTDHLGAAIPHAAVALIDSRTGSVRTAETDGGGRYQLTSFVPGLYRMEVHAPGFQGQSLLIDLSSVQQAVRSVALEAGQSSQTVNVEETSVAASSAPAPLDRQSSGLTVKSHQPPLAALASRPPLFVVTTDTGERWVSFDGQNWTPE